MIKFGTLQSDYGTAAGPVGKWTTRMTTEDAYIPLSLGINFLPAERLTSLRRSEFMTLGMALCTYIQRMSKRE